MATMREERLQAVRELSIAWQQTNPLLDKYEFYYLLREHVGRGKLSYADVEMITGVPALVIKDRFRYLAQLAEHDAPGAES